MYFRNGSENDDFIFNGIKLANGCEEKLLGVIQTRRNRGGGGGGGPPPPPPPLHRFLPTCIFHELKKVI